MALPLTCNWAIFLVSTAPQWYSNDNDFARRGELNVINIIRCMKQSHKDNVVILSHLEIETAIIKPLFLLKTSNIFFYNKKLLQLGEKKNWHKIFCEVRNCFLTHKCDISESAEWQDLRCCTCCVSSFYITRCQGKLSV